MIVDCHTYAWDSSEQLGRCRPSPRGFGDDSPAYELQEDARVPRHLAAAEPVDVTVVMGFKSRYLGAEIPNDRIAAYVRDYPDRLIGFAGIDPSDPKEAIPDLRHARNELGMRGLAVAPAAQDFHPSNSQAMRVYAEAVRLEMPILFHSGVYTAAASKLEYARPFLLDEIARELPTLKIIIARLGYPWVAETIVLLGKHPNVFTEISGLLHRPWSAYQSLLCAYQSGVMNKLLFASGFPFSWASQSIEALYSINHFCHGTNLPTIPREQLRGIVHRDALKLLGITAPREPVPSPLEQEVHDFEAEVT